MILPKRWVGLTLIGFGLFAITGVVLLFITFWQQLYYWPYTDPPRLGQVIVFGIIGIVGIVLGLFISLLVQSIRKREMNLMLYRINLIFGILALAGGVVTIAVAAPSYQYAFYTAGPYLTWANNQAPSNAMTVSWHSATPTLSEVRYGSSPTNLSLSAKSPGITYLHHVPLENLLSNTTYYYLIQDFPIKQFTTAPSDPSSFTFVVYSDPRTNDPPEAAITQTQITRYITEALSVQKISPAFTLFTGDAASRGVDYKGWKIWLDDISKNDLASNASLIHVIGNHERHDDCNMRNFPQYVPYENTSFSVDYGQLHITTLDNWDYLNCWWGGFSPELETWLENDLMTYNSSKFKIIALHDAPVSNGWLNPEIFPTLDRLCRKYSVDAVFFGHYHHYEANLINGTYYMMFGIGGNDNLGGYSPNNAPFQLDGGAYDVGYCQVDMTPTSMHIRPRWINGTWMQSYVITK